MGCALGADVGYSVRFEEAMYVGGVETRVRYMTEGVLMR
jgi:HrpA-like RNA helicase